MLSAGAPPPKFGTRLEVLLDRAAGHASSPLTPNSGATLYAAESPSVSNLGAGLQQISLVTDTAPESARPAGFNAPAPRPDSEPVHEPSALALFAEHADRLRIWGRLDEADALEARLKGALGGLTSSDFGTLLAMPEPQTYDMDFAIPNFTMEEEHEPCSGVWGVHEPSPTEPPAFFAVPNDQDLDLAPLYADDETQLDPEEEERERLAELERQQKKESASIATKWTAGKAWGDHWVKDVTDATYDPRDPLSLAPALAHHLHVHHHSRPTRRFVPSSLLVSQSLFAFGPAASSWLFPKPGDDDEVLPVQKDAALLDISEAALRGVLGELAEGVDAVRIVRSWTEKLRDPEFIRTKCATLQAFLSSLSLPLAAFDEKIGNLDLDYRRNPEQVPTLLALSAKLAPDVKILSSFLPLLDLLSNSLHLGAPELSSIILSELYRTIDSNRLTWPSAITTEWMRIWNDSMVPMVRWMESWVCGRRWEGVFFVRRDPDPTTESGFRYEIENDALPTFFDAKFASKLLSVGRAALHLRRLQTPISAPAFSLHLPSPSAAPFKPDVNAALRRCVGGTDEWVVGRFWDMLHKQGMRDAFESVWGLGLGMDADWRSSVLESVIGKNPLVWRNETFLNRVMASYVATLDLRVTVRLRVPLAGGEFFGVDAWEGVAGEWDIPYPLSVVLSGDIWGLVARIGAFILQIAHAKKLATDLDWLKITRTNPNSRSSSGRVVQKLRVALRMALVAVAEGLQGHFLTTIIAPELDKFRQRLSAEPTDPDELSQAHLEMLQRIAACCMLGTRASGIHRTIVSVLGLYAEYETFCRHYDEDSFAALSEAVAALQARHAKEDRADVESGMDDEQLFVRRKARDVEKRRLVDTFMIRALTKLREDFDLGLGRTVQALETLEAYSSRYQLEGLIFALRGALANTEEAQDM